MLQVWGLRFKVLRLCKDRARTARWILLDDGGRVCVFETPGLLLWDGFGVYREAYRLWSCMCVFMFRLD